MKGLLDSYQGTLRTVNKAKATAIEEDSRILSSVETSLRYIIAWLETGFEPRFTDVSSYSHARREIPVDPAWLAKYRSAQTEDIYLVDEDEEYDSKVELRAIRNRMMTLLDDLLATLTPKEREALILIRGMCISYKDAAEIMGYKSRGSVERMVTSALDKLRKTASKPPDGDDIYLLKPVQVIMGL